MPNHGSLSLPYLFLLVIEFLVVFDATFPTAFVLFPFLCRFVCHDADPLPLGFSIAVVSPPEFADRNFQKDKWLVKFLLKESK
jgi:hypothetical protein